MSGPQTNLLTGLAVHLAAAGLGTWNASAAYTSAQTGITIGTVPQTPDRCITLTAYPVADDPSLSDSVMGVQVRCRWAGSDPRLVDDLADQVFTLLHGLTALTLTTGVYIVQCLRRSGVGLGQDANGRWENSQNFYIDVHRPSTHRT